MRGTINDSNSLRQEPDQLLKFDFLKDILNFLPDATFVIDSQGRVILWNLAMEELSGIKAVNILGKGNYEYSIPFYGKRSPKLIDMVLNNDIDISNQYEVFDRKGIGLSAETSFFADKGSSTYVRLTAFPIHDEMGFKVGAVESIRDLGNYHKIVEALKDTETRFLGLAEGSPAMIFLFQENRMLYVNPEFCLKTGFSEKECLNKNFWDFFHPQYQEMIRKRGLARQQGQAVPQRYEAIILSKEKKEIWVDLYATEISYSGKPAVTGLLYDISERKNAENELQKSEVLYRAIFETTGTAMMIFDESMLVTLVNSEFEKLSLYSKEEIENKLTWPVFISDDDLERMKGYHFQRRINPEGVPKNYEFKLINKKGELRDIHISVDLIPGTGNSVCSFMDITERKRAEAEVRYLSFNDRLTGLYNRAFFEEEVNRLDSERLLPIALIMGDINGLKLVNDALGHQVGDKLLVSAAQILKKSCRGEDIVARWGGDEFIILLPRTGINAAERVVKTIKESTAEVDGLPIPPSISLGMAVKENSSQDIRHIIREAEERMYRNKLLESRSTRHSFIIALERSLWLKSHETEEHCHRLKIMAERFARVIILNESDLDNLRLLTALHDIGKISIPDSILNKAGKLSDEEWEISKKHSEAGYRIALALPELSLIADAILAHHERWDGKGYPLGLKGEEIPLISRMLAIIDSYDVMIDGRPYQSPISEREAVEELEKCAGSQFDPELVGVFVNLLDKDSIFGFY